jgi:hypothetical protein
MIQRGEMNMQGETNDKKTGSDKEERGKDT